MPPCLVAQHGYVCTARLLSVLLVFPETYALFYYDLSFLSFSAVLPVVPLKRSKHATFTQRKPDYAIYAVEQNTPMMLK